MVVKRGMVSRASSAISDVSARERRVSRTLRRSPRTKFCTHVHASSGQTDAPTRPAITCLPDAPLPLSALTSTTRTLLLVSIHTCARLVQRTRSLSSDLLPLAVIKSCSARRNSVSLCSFLHDKFPRPATLCTNPSLQFFG